MCCEWRQWFCALRLELIRTPKGLDSSRFKKDMLPWQEWRLAEYMTRAPLGSLNSVGGVATKMNAFLGRDQCSYLCLS
jgi:hypothetical protein